jgi:hypothetical protein
MISVAGDDLCLRIITLVSSTRFAFFSRAGSEDASKLLKRAGLGAFVFGEATTQGRV